MAVGDPDDLAFDEGELVFVLAREVEEGDGFAVHFFVGRGDGELVVARVAGVVGGVVVDVGVRVVVAFGVGAVGQRGRQVRVALLAERVVRVWGK